MEIVWIAAAFLLGLGARSVGLPPLVGYLATGFLLFALGDLEQLTELQALRDSELLRQLADVGITLLLFTIGLKLRVGGLLMPQIWGVALSHLGLSLLLIGVSLAALGLTGLSLFSELSLPAIALIAFALSFSSTVFAVKVLDENGESNALYGRIAIGILIMQDVAAVAFLAASTGKIPSPWALLLLTLIPLRHVLFRILDRSGHGELLIMFGLTVAIGGAGVFDLVGVKGDLGALILGATLAAHPKSHELAKHLLGFKDLFLVGFFLSIGLAGLPSIEALGAAALLMLLIPIKGLLFFWLLTRFHLRSRTAFLGTLSLANYSEFGLIVAAIAVGGGWIGSEWLTIIAVALAISFLLAAPFNTFSHNLYLRYSERLRRYQTEDRIPHEEVINPGDAEVLIFGMGRVGTGAYDSLHEHLGHSVLGLDLDESKAAEHAALGRNVICASASDPDFWSRFHIEDDKVRLIMLALPNLHENLFVIETLRARGFRGHMAAIAKYPDDGEQLEAAGADAAFNLYAEAGIGFADDVYERLYGDRAESAT